MIVANDEKKRILFVVEAMGGGIFTYIVDLSNELCKKYDMYIAYGIRRQTPKDYLDYFDPSIHMIYVENFTREISPMRDIRAFSDIKKIAEKVKPDIIHLHSTKKKVAVIWWVMCQKCSKIKGLRAFGLVQIWAK